MKIAIAALAVCLPAFSQSLDMVGWQFHERNIPKVEDAIRRAPAYGVNFAVFSHELFRHVDEFLHSPERREEIRRAAAACDKAGIAHWLWVHELDDIPADYREGKRAAGRVEFDRTDLHAYLTRRYEALLDAVPGTAGLILTFHESGARIFQNTTVASAKPVPERMVLLTRLIDSVARKRGKKLILRNFFYEPQEMKWFEEALKSLPEDIMVMRKDTCHEFNPFYPADPAHGTSGRKELMEIDLGVEKALGWSGHYTQVDFVHQYVGRAHERHLAGVVGRARLMWDEPFEDTHEINLYAFGRFARDRALSVDGLWAQWAAARYPEPARAHVIRALRRSEWIQHHTRWVMGVWFTKWIGEQWNNYEYYFGHPVLRANSKWTNSAADRELERRVYQPDRQLYEQAVAEKDEALKQVKASLADVEEAARYLTPAEARRLREGFLWLQDAASLYREWVRAYLAQRLYITTRQEDWRAIAEDALQRLERMDREGDSGRNAATGHRYNIDRFAFDMRRRMRDVKSAREEDERILKDVRRQLNVEEN